MKVNSDDWKSIEEATDDPYKTCQLISDIAVGYDGYEEVKSLKLLIDELAMYARMCLSKARKRGDVE